MPVLAAVVDQPLNCLFVCFYYYSWLYWASLFSARSRSLSQLLFNFAVINQCACLLLSSVCFFFCLLYTLVIIFLLLYLWTQAIQNEKSYRTRFYVFCKEKRTWLDSFHPPHLQTNTSFYWAHQHFSHNSLFFLSRFKNSTFSKRKKNDTEFMSNQIQCF